MAHTLYIDVTKVSKTLVTEIQKEWETLTSKFLEFVETEKQLIIDANKDHQELAQLGRTFEKDILLKPIIDLDNLVLHGFKSSTQITNVTTKRNTYNIRYNTPKGVRHTRNSVSHEEDPLRYYTQKYSSSLVGVFIQARTESKHWYSHHTSRTAFFLRKLGYHKLALNFFKVTVDDAYPTEYLYSPIVTCIDFKTIPLLNTKAPRHVVEVRLLGTYRRVNTVNASLKSNTNNKLGYEWDSSDILELTEDMYTGLNNKSVVGAKLLKQEEVDTMLNDYKVFLGKGITIEERRSNLHVRRVRNIY